MKTYAFGIGLFLEIFGFGLLLSPGGYSFKFGEQHPYQSILAGVLLICVGCYAIYYSKPFRTLGFPKTKIEKEKRIKHIRFIGICFLCGALVMSFFIPGGYAQPLELRDLKEVPTAFLELLVGAVILYLPVSVIAYLSNEI